MSVSKTGNQAPNRGLAALRNPVDANGKAKTSYALIYIDTVDLGRDRWKLTLVFAPETESASNPSPVKQPKLGEQALPSSQQISQSNLRFTYPNTDTPAPVIIEDVSENDSDEVGVQIALSALTVDQGPGPYMLTLVNLDWVDPLFASALVVLIDGGEGEFSSGTESLARDQAPPLPISYLAKDYDSMRALMLAELRRLSPDWQGASSADLGITLVELLAYVGDYLSYYQDATATEAQFETARLRTSVARHMRLLGQVMDQGRSPRVWMQFVVRSKFALPVRSALLTGANEAVIERDSTAYSQRLSEGALVFETLADARLDPLVNTLYFYTWSESDFSIERGATQAVFHSTKGLADALKPGDLLLLTEQSGIDVASPVSQAGASRVSGESGAATQRRHVVRITGTRVYNDQGQSGTAQEGVEVIEITWDRRDALPFSLPVTRTRANQTLNDLSVAQGNLVLADLGQTCLAHLGSPTALQPFTPQMSSPTGPLVFCTPYNPLVDRDASAGELLEPTNKPSLPDVQLRSGYAPWLVPASGSATMEDFLRPASGESAAADEWLPRRDLLASGAFAREFVAEPEDDGSIKLRFGDGELGRKPRVGEQFVACFRTGQPLLGNVGRGAINALVAPSGQLAKYRAAVHAVANPMAAVGGSAAATVAAARRAAKAQFRIPQSCLNATDYQRLVGDFEDVAEAAVEFGWTGSWPSVRVFVRRNNGLVADALFRLALLAWLKPRRPAGETVRVLAVRYLPINIELAFSCKPGFRVAHVRAALSAQFSSQPGGYFDPDNWGFGQPLFASSIIQQALATPGVEVAEVVCFAPVNETDCRGTTVTDIVYSALRPSPQRMLQPAFNQVIKLDNDPQAPMNGRIQFRAVVAQ